MLPHATSASHLAAMGFWQGVARCQTESCSACSPADPKTDTVKVDPDAMGKACGECCAKDDTCQGKENVQPVISPREDALKAEALRLAREEDERRQRHRQWAEEERRQQELQATRIREARAAEAARIQEAEEKRARLHQEMEQKTREYLRAQREEEEQRERECKERLALETFLECNGFPANASVEGVNAKRRRLMRSTYPLHEAVKKANWKVVELLLAAGADPAMKNSSGQTALQMAEKLNKDFSHAQVLKALRAAGH